MFRQTVVMILVIFAAGCRGSEEELPKAPVPVANQLDAEMPKHAKLQAITEDYTKLVLEATDALNRITDGKTALAAAEQLRRNAAQARQVADKMRAVGRLTREDSNRVSSRSIDAAGERHAKANMKLRKLLEGEVLPQAADTALREALLDWSVANTAISEAMTSILPRNGGANSEPAP